MWLGVDLGDARVGLALSDPLLTLAYPIGNIDVHGDSFRAIDEVIDVIEEHCVTRIIIGLPLMLDGTEGKSAKKARRWGRNLDKRIRMLIDDREFQSTTVPDITWVDERLTTVSAHNQLLEANVTMREHRAMVDQQSAVLILQSELDNKRDNCE